MPRERIDGNSAAVGIPLAVYMIALGPSGVLVPLALATAIRC